MDGVEYHTGGRGTNYNYGGDRFLLWGMRCLGKTATLEGIQCIEIG